MHKELSESTPPQLPSRGSGHCPPALFTEYQPAGHIPSGCITDCIHRGVSARPIPSPRLLPHLLLPRNRNPGSCHVSRLSTPHPQSRGAWQMQTEVPTVPTDPSGLLRAEPAVIS